MVSDGCLGTAALDMVASFASRVAFPSVLRPRAGAKSTAIAVTCSVRASRDDSTTRYLEEGKQRRALPITILHYSHGGPHFGSVDTPQRMAQLSKLGEFWLHWVGQMDVDVAVYVESDLIWDARTILQLVERTGSRDFTVFAPLVFAGPHFYDVWGFRGLDGAQFGPTPPYHSSLADWVECGDRAPIEPLTEVSSVGSCVAFPRYAAADVPSMNGNAFVGWCEGLRTAGYRILVDPTLSVRHPA